MIRYIVTNALGVILKSGFAATELAALEQGAASELVHVLDNDPGLIDDAKVKLNLATGTFEHHPDVVGPEGPVMLTAQATTIT